MDSMTPEQIQQMIAMLQKMLPETNTEDTESKPAIKTKPSKQIKSSSINKFDEMVEAHLHKADIEIDKKLNKYGPTPRLRQFDPVNVVCRVCGKKDIINPSLLSDSIERYKCNQCARSAG